MYPLHSDKVNMLKPRALTAVLSQANTDGVHSSFVFRHDGTLLAFSSVKSDSSDPRVVAAIASKIWGVYEKSGRAALDQNTLEMLLLDCDEGHVGVVPAHHTLICLIGDRDLGFGMLKAKADALVRFLEDPLSQIGVA